MGKRILQLGIEPRSKQCKCLVLTVILLKHDERREFSGNMIAYSRGYTTSSFHLCIILPANHRILWKFLLIFFKKSVICYELNGLMLLLTRKL